MMQSKQLEGLWFDRTLEYSARIRRENLDPYTYATRENLRLVPLPCWDHLSKQGYAARIEELVQQVEIKTAARHALDGTRPLGLKSITSQGSHDRPRELKKTHSPAFHAATKAARQELIEAYRWFAGAYREAAAKLVEGRTITGFPLGCFPPRPPFVGWVPEATPG
jgi:hypothetical protein